MKSIIEKEKGGALLAVLLLIPVFTVGGLASYKMANNSAEMTTSAALEADALFSAENVSEKILAEIVNGPALQTEIINAAEGGYIKGASACQTAEDEQNGENDPIKEACAGDTTYTRRQADPRYQNITTQYMTKKVTPLSDADPDTIAVEIIVRTYNSNNPVWRDKSKFVEHIIYQEFTKNLEVKAVGCAAKYDFFADEIYEVKSIMSFDFFTKGAYYAGEKWKSTGLNFSLSRECIDNPGNDATKNGSSICWRSRVDCNATNISFGHAIYGDADIDDNKELDRDQITNLNICGSEKKDLEKPHPEEEGKAKPYFTSGVPYPFTSLEKTVIDKISTTARTKDTRPATLAALNSDYKTGTVGRIKAGEGYWYFKKSRVANVPAIDTPYFYYSSDELKPGDSVDMNSILPFSIDMMRLRNTYMYVNGDIKQFQLMGSGSGVNFRKFYLIASGSVSLSGMMDISMMDAGSVILAGGKVEQNAAMKGDGLSSWMIMANDSIELKGLMSMGVGTRTTMLSGENITVKKGFSMSMGAAGGNHGSCGCDGSSNGETEDNTKIQIGRRFIRS